MGQVGSWAVTAGVATTSPALGPPTSPTWGSADGSSKLVGDGGRGGADISYSGQRGQIHRSRGKRKRE